MKLKHESSSAEEFAPDPEINVTPFIDVMLVLLIIFMVTAPMMAAGMKLDLPRVADAKPLEPASVVVVSIGASGELQVGSDTVTRETLISAVRTKLDERSPVVQLRGDHRVAYGTVVQIMNLLAQAGFGKLAIAVEREPSQPRQ
jgi:biopolymer transport protein ExbD